MNFSRRAKQIKNNAGLYVIFFVVLVYFFIFAYWPMFGVQIAFKEYNPILGITGSPWIGLPHFKRFFNSFYIERLLTNTIGISLYGIIVGIPAPIILALLFNEIKNKRAKTTFQLISYAPNFLSIVVVVSILNFFLSPDNGSVNILLSKLGMEPVNFLTGEAYFWNIFVWSGVWQGVGWGSIVYSAAISGIPMEQYESAIIDGANRLHQIWYITLPGILPTIVIITILSAGNIMNVGFEKVYLMQNNLNIGTSEVISTYVYKSGLLNADYSFSTAVGLFNNLTNFIILVGVNAFAKKLQETSLW